QVASLQTEAYRLERAAAESLLNRFDLEPTRSILFKGAAVLALEVNLARAAEHLACMGLSGIPPDFVAAELRAILERANFQRHLALHGFALRSGGFQLALQGNAVSVGKALMGEVIERYRNIERLL